MTFLQPFILWGLPLVLVPVVIHLLNRLRHRPLPWAAMMFLRSATRKSTRYAQLRQFLILLLRVLAVLGLVLAVSRPLAGGWMGWLTAGAPDTILVLLDRSASMEVMDTGGQISKRARATEVFARSAEALAQTSRLVLLDSVDQDPQEIKPARALLEHPRTGPTDTAADLPALLQIALDWIVRNRPGLVEIWIASDLQRSNWLPESDRWPAVVSGLAALPQSVRVRLLALNRPWEGNSSITVPIVKRRQNRDQAELELVLEIQRSATHSATVPVILTLDGVSSQLDLNVEGPVWRYRHRVPVESAQSGGWGKVALPADVNSADNQCYFVYGPAVPLRAAVLAGDRFVGRVLQLAAAPDPRRTNQVCEIIPAAQGDKVVWDEYGLVFWQRALPEGEMARRLQTYVDEGGVLLLLPPGQTGSWNGMGWGEVQNSPEGSRFEISRWQDQSGPLAGTEEGLSLPLSELQVQKRQPMVGEGQVLAWFEDGSPLWLRRAVGRGQVHRCATLPHPDWSRLQDGSVLVPVVQRLLEEGGQRFSQAQRIECGEELPLTTSGSWSAVDPPEANQSQRRTGVYRAGPRWLAVQRPAREDDPEQLEPDQARQCLGELSLQLFEENRRGLASLQSELWRAFLVGMLVFLLGEAWLILPEGARLAREL
jgi:hypothetical protein